MQTKFVKFVSVKVEDSQAMIVGKVAKVVAEDGTTTTKDWFTGQNAWGFHNDLRFTQNIGTIRQSLRIMEAVEKAVAVAAPCVELLAEDHAMLLEVLKNPSRHQNTTPPPVQLLRAIMPILAAVEEATDAPPAI
jgi:hypothetical protein